MTPEQKDAFLLAQTPVLVVPRFGKVRLGLQPRNSHRFLAASAGLWIELTRPWLYVRALVAPSNVALPYGELAELTTYAFSHHALRAVVNRFIVDAIAALPDECAGCGVWSESEQTLEYRPLASRIASPGSVEYDRPVLGDGEHLAVDLHSHGSLPAFFSATDDADDAGEVKISVVLGGLDGQRDVAIRLCVLGHFIEVER